MIQGIAHLCFTVRDLNAAETFYVQTLGLKHAFDFRDESGRRTGVYLYAGGRNFIEMFEGSHEPAADGQSYRHVCLEVGDIDAVVEHLAGRGVETTEPHMGADGSWQAWLTDPDGNRIELHQYTTDSKQAPCLDKPVD